ncbi:YceI family protein [Flavobacterium sp. ZT3R18]|uniref:YceI family protein n=1 Tax=Flavobacterium sp. ZT3R18 TaxID=2594429 RepID=UPI00117B61F3|nr:YceI family protein [Flavobacterium sp. ZT3R18]TRX33473.1 YceI family protein [Flavobacterium sp. ZT3R18]
MENEWAIDSNESDVLIKSRHSLIDYMSGTKNNFKGHVAIQNDEVEDASIEFSLNVNDKGINSTQKNKDLKLIDFFDKNESPVIEFRSTSFQKINKNINFLKGFLTIKNITKVVELDTEFIGFNNYNGVQKASFEITGNINRKDFGLNYNMLSQNGGFAVGKDIRLIANLEFTH